ncbi:small nuclear ribonucleoprotein [Bacillus glycinifermentans]|uniref:small nuclear ribonucleoprotein n=1 Tax=Bacillus glycinifermentans TaxID=1664069 RepID=UPI001FF65087|nr:small nuclear ribonucleoprotein [Bacillus glycinifermentans]MEC3608704.1 small nuclear ribonucleoprotein [Bacillus glycinifermentans]UOY88068.1 small nuclear ribonucleoprotein [Bacillus glycinifermentans]
MSVPKGVQTSMPHDHDRSLHNLCRKYMHYHVVLKLKDGCSVHGILENAGQREATVYVPERVTEEKQFYGGNGLPIRSYRRFKRMVFPFSQMTSLYPFPYY